MVGFSFLVYIVGVKAINAVRYRTCFTNIDY